MGLENKINLYEYHNKNYQNIKLSYKGPFEEHILYALGNYIKRNLDTGEKVFSVFIELAQNIYFYSAEVTQSNCEEKKAGVGTIIIGDYDTYYKFLTGNVVSNRDISPLVDKCKYINSLDRDGLRRYKREQRSKPRGERGGAHIGMIYVALTSGHQIEYNITEIDKDYCYFSIQIRIDK